MGWNGNGGESSQQKNVKHHSVTSRIHWWAVAITAFGVVVVAFIFLAHKEDRQFVSKERSVKIAEVKHDPSPKKSVEHAIEESITLPQRVQDELKPIVHKARTTTNKYPRRVIQPRERKPKRFVHTSDEMIAHLIETRPGAAVVGHIPFERFEEDFKASIADPIKVKDDDSDYDKELKTAVSETRKEIAKLMGEGRSFAEIMQESRMELQSLAQYKYQLMDQLRELKKNPEVTDDDYGSFVKAANKMLESKGMAPIKMPGLLYRQFKFQENIMEGIKK